MIGETLMVWALAPIDPSRTHDVGTALSWHGRLMTLAWGVLIPLGVVIARYLKVTPRQDWPRQLDNKMWWHGHLACQYTGGICMVAGLIIILFASRDGAHWQHRSTGYTVLVFGAMQFVAGWLRGSKGGPTDTALRGDHYDMTLRRIVFERLHKAVGYLSLGLAAFTILTGLWAANAPRWMWVAIICWWLLLLVVSLRLQSLGRHVSSYHAIWGPDVAHPGNRR
jgi:hypothetical protein